MIKYIYSSLFVLSICFCSIAQQFDWANQIGGEGFEIANGVTVDAEGSVLTIGSYQGTIDTDPGPGTFELSNSGFDDVFISKVDADGQFLWAKKFGGSSFDVGYDVVTDGDGNVYTTGYFSETIDFDPGAGTFNMTSGGLYDCFISKLDSDGNFVWAKQFTGAQFEIGYALTLDNDGNIILTGAFNGEADFDPGSGTSTLTPAGGYDAFVAKLNADGNFIWAGRLGGSVDDEGHDVVVDASGAIYTTGFFWGLADFDPSAAVSNLTSAGNFDIYVHKLAADGSFQWAKQMGGDGEDQGRGIALDADGSILLTGYFSNTSDFDPGAANFDLSSEGVYDAFVTKLDNSGAFTWAKSFGSFGEDISFSVDVDGSGQVYLCGSFEFGIDADPGDGATFLIANGGEDAFQSILDSSGEFVWAAQIGGGSDDRAISIQLDENNAIYTTGYFEQTADFDPSGEAFTLTADGNFDVFTQKLIQCSNTSSDQSVTACDSYTSPSGNYTWTSSGVYSDTIPNSTGCDSIITIDLTIPEVNVGVTQTMDGFIADAVNAAYQWITCAGDMVDGAIEQSFLPEVTGSYAVIVTETCTDTSECLDWVVGLEENLAQQIQLRMNRESGLAQLDLGRNFESIHITLIDITGKQVAEETYRAQQQIDFFFPSTPGIYFIRVEADALSTVLKVSR
ncbi:MAG: hypothetical protein HKN79_00500 [Flavobacteriales bacterium]|nr:hypothetical protein [Flavobacteriales bacterium]